jgi:hypothetical protein
MACKAHDDRSPSLQVTPGDKGLLVKCWSGCSLGEICTSLGIRPPDLFYDNQLNQHGRRPPPKPVKIDRTALAFRFQLGGLDRRLRAEKIIEAGKNLDVASLSDDELDRAMNAIANAYDDVARAEVFEQVADGLMDKHYRRAMVAR